jgi:tol-pal system protein YbgF
VTDLTHSRAWGAMAVVAFAPMLWLTGCAKHADFVEVRDQLSTISRSQDQDHQRVDAVLRRLESVERVKDVESGKPRIDEVTARLQKLEARLAKLEETMGQPPSARFETPPSEPRPGRPAKPSGSPEGSTIVPGVPSITPTSAFNLAYNDYLNGKYDLAVAGFQRFTKDFPGTSLTPNAQYWLGESYYNLKDYVRAIESFEYLVAEYPGNEKMPAALYKLGLATAETGDLVKSRKYLKRVLEEFPASDESKLAKNKLAEIR